MSSPEQQVMDYINSVGSSIHKYASELSQYASEQLGAPVDKVMDKSVMAVRGGIKSILVGLGLEKKVIIPPPIIHRTLWQRSQDWMSRNRAITAAMIAFIGTGAIGGLLVYSHHLTNRRLRKAKKAKNGARKEVVVVAGSPTTSFVRSIIHDLDKRGFVVYVIVTSLEERMAVEREGKPDIIPLSLELSDSEQAIFTVDRFSDILTTAIQAFPGASPHYLDFKGIIIAPDLYYPTAAIQDLSSDVWSDALSTKVLSTINVAQAFLPLVRRYQSRMIFATPVILGALCLPYTSIENVSINALEAFILTLRREVKRDNISITHLKCGSFDFGVSRLVAAQDHARYGLRSLDQLGKFKPSSPSDLHHAIFDALTTNRSWSTIRVGRGSMAYDLVGRLVPSSLVDWMIGRKQIPVSQNMTMMRSIEGWESVVGES